MSSYDNDQSLAIPKENMMDIQKPGDELPSIIPPTTNEMVTMMLRTAGTLEATDEQKEILFAPVDPETVEIRPDGLIYLPAMEYRDKLCQAFGIGWALLPADPKPQREGNLIVWPHYLFIQGRPVALVYGEQEYRPNNYTMTYGDAIEGAASNALMRACKRINVNKELWRPSFICQWKEKYAEAYIVPSGRNKGKTQWRRKEVEADAEEPTVADVSDEAHEPASEDTQEPNQAFDPSDTSFWRRKAMQHAGDLGMPEAQLRQLVQDHFFLYDAGAGEYMTNLDGSRIPVREKKQLYWTQWKKLAQHLYDTWVAAGKPKIAKSQPEEEQGDQEDPPKTKDGIPVEEAVKDAVDQGVQETKEREEAIDAFVELAKTKFASEIVRDDWIKIAVSPKPMGEWSVSETAFATQALSRLTDLPGAHVPPKKSTQQDEDEHKREEAKSQFLEMAAKRFTELKEREAWIIEWIAPINGIDKIWDVMLFHKGIKLLTEGVDDPKMTGETRTALRNALAEFPGKIYQTMKSRAFRKFANGAIDGSMVKVSDLTEKQGKVIVWKLAKEKAEIEEKVEQTKAELLDEDGDPLEDGMVTPEDAKDEAERQEAFNRQQPEQQAGAHWIDHELEKGEVAGEVVDEDPLTQGPETSINPDQFAEIKALLSDMPERFHNSIGSEAFTDFMADVVGHRVYGMLTLSYDQASDIIHAMNDMITDEVAVLAEIKRKSEERKPTVI